MKHVTACLTLCLWCFFFTPPGAAEWLPIPGQLKEISVGSDGLVWGTNTDGNIFRKSNDGWVLVDGLLAQVSVGNAEHIWGVNAQDQIFKWDHQGQTWESVPGLLTQVSAGCDGTVWGINASGLIYAWNSRDETWDTVPGLLKQVSVGSKSNIWGINEANQVFAWDSQSNEWEAVPGLLSQVSVGCDGTAWGVNAQGLIYAWDPAEKAWESVPGQLQQVSVGSQSDIWGINDTGQVFMDVAWSAAQDLSFIPANHVVVFSALHQTSHTQVVQITQGGTGPIAFTNAMGEAARFPITGTGSEAGYFERGTGFFVMKEGLTAQFADSGAKDTTIGHTPPATFGLPQGGGFAWYGTDDLSTRFYLYWFSPEAQQTAQTPQSEAWSAPDSLNFIPEGKLVSFFALYATPQKQMAKITDNGAPISFSNGQSEPAEFPISGQGSGVGFFENGTGLFRMKGGLKLALLDTASDPTVVKSANPAVLFMKQTIGGTNLYAVKGNNGEYAARVVITWYRDADPLP